MIPAMIETTANPKFCTACALISTKSDKNIRITKPYFNSQITNVLLLFPILTFHMQYQVGAQE